MKMSSTRAAVPSHVQTNTATAEAQITPEVPPPSTGGLVSANFNSYLSRDPKAQTGVNSADVTDVKAEAYAPGNEISQAVGPSNGGFVSAHFNGFLGRDPGGQDAGPNALDLYDAFGWHESHDLGEPRMEDFPFQDAAGLLGADTLNALERPAFADGPHVDILPAVQNFLPAVQNFATEWLWH